MEIFVWLEENSNGREEWKSIGMENGEQFHMVVPAQWRLTWLADNLVMTHVVSHHMVVYMYTHGMQEASLLHMVFCQRGGVNV